MRRRVQLVLLLSLCGSFSTTLAQSTPADPTSNIPWSPANYQVVGDIEAAFNNARAVENSQIGTSWSTNLALPSQSSWDAMTDGEKASFLVNMERGVRNLLPFEGPDPNLTVVAQAYAETMAVHQQLNHTIGGTTPVGRINANPALNGHVQFLGENLFFGSVALPIERAVYMWLYEDSPVSWGNRHICLFSPLNNDYGSTSSEGLTGVGRADNSYVVFELVDPAPDYVLPVQLATFGCTRAKGQFTIITWTTVSEVNNFGFYVQRRSGESGFFTDLPAAFMRGNGTTIMPHEYNFEDTAPPAGDCWYRLRQVDLDGSVHFSDACLVAGAKASDATADVLTAFALGQNYPNPFNPSTTIQYDLPKASFVSLKVFDCIGKEVAALVNEDKGPGCYTVRFDGSRRASGMYFYRIQAGSFIQTKKLLLLR